MTKLYDGQIQDLLNNNFRHDPEIKALGFAVREEKRRILDLALKSRVRAAVDMLDEDILDILAVELRSPYYSSDMEIGQKREIIKNTIRWYFKAGTPAAVREMVAALFGNGEVEEWFDFTEPPFTPGTFDIILVDARMTEDIVERFLAIIQRVKNTRSHLRRVSVERNGSMEEFAGAGSLSEPEIPVVSGGGHTDNGIDIKAHAGAGATSSPGEAVTNNPTPMTGAATVQESAKAIGAAAPSEAVTNNMAARDAGAAGEIKTGSGLTSAPALAVTNNQVPRASSAAGPSIAGAGGTSAPKTTITNNAPARAGAGSLAQRIGAAVASAVHIIVTNCQGANTTKAGPGQRVAAAAVACSNINI